MVDKTKITDSQLEWGSKEVEIRFHKGDWVASEGLFSGCAKSFGVWRFAFLTACCGGGRFLSRRYQEGPLFTVWFDLSFDAS